MRPFADIFLFAVEVLPVSLLAAYLEKVLKSFFSSLQIFFSGETFAWPIVATENWTVKQMPEVLW